MNSLVFFEAKFSNFFAIPFLIYSKTQQQCGICKTRWKNFPVLPWSPLPFLWKSFHKTVFCWCFKSFREVICKKIGGFWRGLLSAYIKTCNCTSMWSFRICKQSFSTKNTDKNVSQEGSKDFSTKMVRGDQGKTGKFFHRVLQIPHCCCVLEYMRNGIAKKLENFASKNTREFILRHPVEKIWILDNYKY